MTKTRSEVLFENFLTANGIRFQPVPTVNNVPAAHRPDYSVLIGAGEVFCEVKELGENPDFDNPLPGEFKVRSLTVGDHVRRLIKRSTKQIQYGAKMGIPSVLIIYNNMDPLQLLGTDRHDFEAAMYGAHSVTINRATGKVSSGLFFGKKKSFTEEMNTSFAAIGHLCDRGGMATLTLYQNCFADPALPYGDLPPCFNVVRAVVEEAPPGLDHQI